MAAIVERKKNWFESPGNIMEKSWNFSNEEKVGTLFVRFEWQ